MNGTRHRHLSANVATVIAEMAPAMYGGAEGFKSDLPRDLNGSAQETDGDLADGDGDAHSETSHISDEIAGMQASLARLREEQETAWSAFREDLAKKERAIFWSKLAVSSTLFIALRLVVVRSVGRS